jgi:signal transduction histidine kinase
MGQAELKIFVVMIGLIVLVFIIGTILLVFQYRKRKLMHNKEKAALEEQHKLDLLGNQLDIQQQTMQFIGSEIHDSVAQKLTLASIYSQKLEFENKVPGIGENIRQISNIINDSLVELRELSRTLTNNHIQDAALTALLQEECEKVNSTGTCKMLLDVQFDDQVSVTVKSFLLRVLQEFIQNSLKHSGCSAIKVELRKIEDGLSVIASDNGRGFDSSQVMSSGIGLNNMQRRIRLIGGRFDLQSTPGKGTQLELFIDNKKLLSEI